MSNNPVCFSHVCISVSDIGEAIKFYHEVFGWYHIAGPFPVERTGPGGDFCDQIYGKDGKQWDSFLSAHMVTADRIGFEIVQFPDGYDPDDDFDYRRHGLFHFAVQTPDVDGLIDEIVAHGGRRGTTTLESTKHDLMGLVQDHKVAFASDPFGNWFEIYSYGYEAQNLLPLQYGR